MTSIPEEHIRDAAELTSDAQVHLFEITLLESAGVIRIWNGFEHTWQSEVYEPLGCQMTKESATTDDQSSRPEWTCLNPDNIFAPYVLDGVLEGATFIRKTLLADNFLNDRNIFERRVWEVARVVNLGDQIITIELKDPSDGPNYLLPARVYMPPDFPSVNLR